MQPKRIITLLLVVALTFICATANIFAADTNEFALAVEVESSTAVLKEPALTVKSGATLDVSVAITANPGIKMLKFAVNYDAKALTLKVDANGKPVVTSGKLFGDVTESVYLDDEVAGKLWYVVDATKLTNDVKATAKVITLTFTVVDNFHGDTNITLSNYNKNAGGGSVSCTTFTFKATDAVVGVHTYSDPTTEAATCIADGKTTYKCTTAGCNHVAEIITETAKGHTEAPMTEKAATCTEVGLTGGKQCSVCSVVLEEQTEVAALGHKFGDWTVEKEATVEAEGLRVRKCTNAGCDATESEPIEKLTPPDEGPNVALIILIIVLAVLVLGGGGFCLYWFVLRKKN